MIERARSGYRDRKQSKTKGKRSRAKSAARASVHLHYDFFYSLLSYYQMPAQTWVNAQTHTHIYYTISKAPWHRMIEMFQTTATAERKKIIYMYRYVEKRYLMHITFMISVFGARSVDV